MRVIVLNGASSSGKTTLARALQDELTGLWLHFGIDGLVAALPPKLLSADGIAFGEDGEVTVGAAFRQAEQAWMLGLAATAGAGVSVIVDDVFLGGAASQGRWQAALGKLPCCWIGVHCDPAEAEKREQARGDRTPGMHAQQAALVHQGVSYDLTVDTSARQPQELARALAAQIRAFWPEGVQGR